MPTYEEMERELRALRDKLEVVRALNVPICGSHLFIPRSLWNEAYLEYERKYRPDLRQYVRLLNEGFHASEMDMLRPNWQFTAREIETLRQQLIVRAANDVFYGDR